MYAKFLVHFGALVAGMQALGQLGAQIKVELLGQVNPVYEVHIQIGDGFFYFNLGQIGQTQRPGHTPFHLPISHGLELHVVQVFIAAIAVVVAQAQTVTSKVIERVGAA